MEKTEEITLDSLLVNRGATYGFLARLYRIEIDEDFYKEMEAMRFPINTGNKNVDEGHRLICGYLSKSWPSAAVELAADYVRTFMGHGITTYEAAYPYESVHTSARRLMMQEARDEVLEIYRAAHLIKDESWKDGEDHLALELEFMHVLNARALEALAAGDEGRVAELLEQESTFLDNHLLNWVFMLAADIEKFAATDFYKGLAKLTIGFLETDAEFLDEILNVEDVCIA